MCPRLVVRFAVALALVAPVATVAPAQEPTRAKATGKLVDLNTATAEELMELPGVGEATAKKIREGRPFASMEALKDAGIPERTIEKLRPVATVKAATTKGMEKAEKKAEKIETKAEKAKEAAAAPVAGEAVDLNTADEAALLELPNIGPTTAKAIMAARPFASLDGLEKVKGLGPAKIAALKGRVKVGASAARPPTAPVADETPTSSKAKTKATTTAKSKAATVLPPGEKININTASLAELDRLPGIGPVRAQAIVDGRPFKAIEDIKTVKGIKDGEFGKIQGMITVK